MPHLRPAPRRLRGPALPSGRLRVGEERSADEVVVDDEDWSLFHTVAVCRGSIPPQIRAVIVWVAYIQASE